MDLKFNTICRVCLISDVQLINIFQEGLAPIIMTFTTVKVLHEDGFPQNICKMCWEELKIAVRFKEKCEKSQARLYEYLDPFSNIDSQISPNNTNFYPLITKRNDETYNQETKPKENCQLYNIIRQEYFHEGKSEVYSAFECTICKKQELSLSAIQEHECEKIYNCEYCSDKFVSAEIYKIHLKNHESVKFKCEHCRDTFFNKTDLENHLKQHESKKVYRKRRKMQQCELCGKITNYRSELATHMRLHSGERPYKCDICAKSFRLRSFLRKHLLTHAGVRSHHCMFCPKSFVLKTNLNCHLKTHSGEKQFNCNICNKKFKSSRSLTHHLKIHTGERNYPCMHCEKAFVNRFDLRRHLQLHEKYKAIEDGTYDKSQARPKQMHQCENCGKFFPSKGDLTKHKRVHTGEKPFKCQYCDKAFAGSSALTVHTRIHTGTKPYTCHHCGLSFAQSSNLKVHIRLHTGDRPYPCTMCDKGYNRKRDLDAHLKKHITD